MGIVDWFRTLGRGPAPLTQREYTRLVSLKGKAEAQVRHKQFVMGRHKPGTSYHTRAKREEQVWRAKLKETEKELARGVAVEDNPNEGGTRT